jgi:2-polyprenyl-3-methyl-5-hydroxy-6-metoxy-1,4-benzoquinol methylase
VNFIVGGQECVPFSDIIIASHVLEHLENERDVINELRSKCKRLFIIVPFEEENACEEHMKTYNVDTYHELQPNALPCVKLAGVRS